MQNNLIYSTSQSPRTLKEWIAYTTQFVFAVLPATILISSICGTSIAAGLVSAGLGTLVFLLITGFKVPVCTSNSGATVSAVIGALLLTNSVEKNFTAVILGGLIMMAIYTVAGLVVRKSGTQWLTNLLPPVVSGTVVLIIGVTLMSFIPSYAQVNGAYSLLGVFIGLAAAFVCALFGTYGKGIVKTLPFLFTIIIGYVVCIVLTLIGVAPLVDFAKLNFTSVLSVPDFAFLHINFADLTMSNVLQTALMFATVSMAAMTEHIADITTAGQVAGENFVGKYLHRTLIGDGVSSFVGALTGAQMTTTYSEYTSTMAVSRVASVKVTFATAITLICLGFITPFNQLLAALPNAVFAGISMAAYGMIALVGVRALTNANVDFNKSRNTFIFAIMMSCGCSGIAISAGVFNLTGVALSIIVGVILNIVLKDKENV